jgi:glycosyltransferase involved in cell wall biosynthesis
MHVIIINYNDFQRFEALESLMRYYFPLIGWAKGLVAAGATVTVFQRYRENLVISREGIPIHLVTDSGPDTTPYQIPLPLHRQVVTLARALLRQGDQVVVHLNGLLYPLQTRLLRYQLPKTIPIIVQHHGSLPWAKGVRRRVQRWGLRGVDSFLFTAVALADEWIEAGIISDSKQVHEVMETSAIFQYEDRPSALAKTGMYGLPVVFWAGNLNENKDPLTVLRGFELLLEEYPQAHLFMAYREAPLLKEVQNFLAESRTLSKAVTLLGAIPHEQMANYFNSADLFVQGSSKEGSGLAVVESLACGVVPIVTDIPAFRVIIGQGQVGALWPVGDAAALAQGMKNILKQPIAKQSSAARDFFEANWHFGAIGRRTLSIYREVLTQRAR